MDYKEIVKTALQALKSNILRTALTMIGIIIGITAVILIVSIGRGAVAFITNELTSFGTDYFQIRPGSDNFSSFTGTNTLTLKDVEAIRNDVSLTNVNEVAPAAVTNAVVKANEEEDAVTIMGASHEMFDVLKPEITYGEFLTEESDLSAEKIAVVGSEIANKFYGEDTDPTGETLRIQDSTFRVVGVMHSTSALAGSVMNNTVIIPIHVAFTDLIGEEKIQEIDVSVHDENQINQTIEDVELLLRDTHNLAENRENDFRIESAQDILTTVQTITGLLTTMIAAISAISLVVGGVGVMNIMLVSVTERTKEIGLLKAIGAKEKDILTQFLVEAVAMSLVGGIIGIILGTGGAFLISLGVGIPFVLDWVAIGMAVGVSTLVGVVFGLYPARRAARLSPIDALRYE